MAAGKFGSGASEQTNAYSRRFGSRALCRAPCATSGWSSPPRARRHSASCCVQDGMVSIPPRPVCLRTIRRRMGEASWPTLASHGVTAVTCSSYCRSATVGSQRSFFFFCYLGFPTYTCTQPRRHLSIPIYPHTVSSGFCYIRIVLADGSPTVVSFSFTSVSFRYRFSGFGDGPFLQSNSFLPFENCRYRASCSLSFNR